MRQIPPMLDLDDAFRSVATEYELADVARVFELFKAHHESKATTSASWLAEWRKWCAREKNIQARERRNGSPSSPGGMSPRVRRPDDEAPVPRGEAVLLGQALLDSLEAGAKPERPT